MKNKGEKEEREKKKKKRMQTQTGELKAWRSRETDDLRWDPCPSKWYQKGKKKRKKIATRSTETAQSGRAIHNTEISYTASRQHKCRSTHGLL